MGERLLCKQEVIGSIPFTSTIERTAIGDRKSEIGNQRSDPMTGTDSAVAGFAAGRGPAVWC